MAGLLNHLASQCLVQTRTLRQSAPAVVGACSALGMVPMFPPVILKGEYLPVLLDGR